MEPDIHLLSQGQRGAEEAWAERRRCRYVCVAEQTLHRLRVLLLIYKENGEAVCAEHEFVDGGGAGVDAEGDFTERFGRRKLSSRRPHVRTRTARTSPGRLGYCYFAFSALASFRMCDVGLRNALSNRVESLGQWFCTTIVVPAEPD